ncbi:Rrf2 family transcriptional regulator [Paenibacillus sp. IB182496]|uniref:Rrf2 family transcriptional regulator n=1 Tax=Paenibacillus sabuli TaxID=2772509 RepID=A0A927BS98_9BACL|nr:Rrf2 family transcriptional regulator [Paenibacillus sabuli]MBD2844820.1 Rrf2 family transcriptional regulator [Paenibacillus sabuli]
MQYSKSTDYALHALIHLAQAEGRENIGIKPLAHSLGVSESYLSKIMSKLRQDGLVRSVTGVKGGYELARPPRDITFLDVIQVIEGRQELYVCSNLDSKQHRTYFAGPDEAPPQRHDQCLVKRVMDGAQQQMDRYLRGHTIQTVLDEAAAVRSEECSSRRTQA